MKINSVGVVNPVAKAMLQERKHPQVIPPKKGGKATDKQKHKKKGEHNE